MGNSSIGQELPRIARHENDSRRLRGLHHLDLVLPDAHGFDEHDVEAGRVQDIDGVRGGAGQAAQRAAGRHRSDEDSGIRVELRHSDAVSQDGPAGKGGGRIDSHDPNGLPPTAISLRQALDERGLAGSRRAGQSDDASPARFLEEGAENLRTPAVAFDRGDRAADGATVT